MPLNEEDQGKLRIDVLQKFYVEHATQARQHETLRDRSTALMVTISAALGGFLGSNFQRIDAAPFKAVATLVVALGVFGALVSYKHYERNRMHVRIVGALRHRVNAELKKLTGLDNEVLMSEARSGHEAEFAFHRVRTYSLWIAINLAVAVVGMVLILIKT